jgi:hypothetical protein
MITSSTNKITYKGDGSTKVFAIPFNFIESKDLAVYIVKDGVTTQLEKDYYIDTTAKNVNYPGYASGEEPAESEQPAVLAEGEQIVIARSIPLTQERDLGDIWPFDETEKALDKLTMIAQDNQEKLNRSLKLSISSPFAGDLVLPDPKPKNCIVWNIKGTGLENADVLTPVTEQAEAAKASAEAAKASKEAAKQSAAEAKKVLDFNVADYYTKTEVDEKIASIKIMPKYLISMPDGSIKPVNKFVSNSNGLTVE